jgi:hypothetical protein
MIYKASIMETDYYQTFFTKNQLDGFYHASMVRTDMEEWLNNIKNTYPCNR